MIYFGTTISSMASPLRIEFPGALYHITSKGDCREDIFISDEDRSLFIEVYSRTAERFGWLCHAYCLMSNHYHLVIGNSPDRSLRRYGLSQWVYTRKFNREHKGNKFPV